VAVRLANLAFSNVYGLADAVPAGPQFQRYTREGDKLRIYFETFGSKLTTTDGQAPAFFEILPEGKNQSFVKAQAEIDGNSVLVWNDDVKKPVDVRFAFREQDLMHINLTNSAGIPVATFWADATHQLHPDLSCK
jgi:sialate O-acetylesterase